MANPRWARTYADDDLRRLLPYIASGLGDADIGRHLHLCTSAITKRVAALCEQLDARNRTHLVARAYECHLLIAPERTAPQRKEATP